MLVKMPPKSLFLFIISCLCQIQELDSKVCQKEGSIYSCDEHQECCNGGCCDRVYLVWYVWLLIVVSVLCCCFIGYLIKRSKRRKRRSVHPRTLEAIVGLNVTFTTRNSTLRHEETIGIGGYNRSEFGITPVEPFTVESLEEENIIEDRAPPPYCETAPASSAQRRQNVRFDEAPPSYSSIWS